jgi:hypothetical protein
MGQTDARPGSDATNHPTLTESAGHYVWNALEHMSGASTIKAIMRTETVSNALHDFKLIDDGTAGFNDLARKHVEEKLNGSQRKNLENERDSYGNGLLLSGIPSIFSPEVPEKGPLMKQFDSTVDSCVKEAQKRVERGMTSDEMKQYHDEVKSYELKQLECALIPGIKAEKGPMMLEYEKRFAAAIKQSNVSWQDKNS